MNSNLISPRADPKKRLTSSQIRPKQIGTPTSARRILSVPPSKCSLCEKKVFKPDDLTYFNAMVHRSLYAKYASSQNYYYTKDINEMLADSHTPAVIMFKDLQCYDEDDEYLKRMYKVSEYNNKIQLLTEYYKFHWDIPRMFMLPTTEVLNRFHDKKRRLQYIRVTKMLKDQKESKHPQTKSPEQTRPKQEESKPATITDRVLVDLETSYSILKAEEMKGYVKKPKLGVKEQENAEKCRKMLEEENIQELVRKGMKRGTTKEIILANKARDEVKAHKKIQKKKEAEEQPKDRETSGSRTLQELNLKLGEIISNSDTTNLFDQTEQSFSQSVTNLKSFLTYLKSNQATTPKTTNPVANIMPKENPRSISTKPDLAKKSLSLKPSTPRQENKEDENLQQAPLTSRASIITWNRRDSVPLVRPSPSNLTRRDSKATNEVSKGDEKPKEAEAGPVNILGSARILSAQSSLSSTANSKSKSVYPSVSKIRNFEEAVKISQQTTQQKVDAPAGAVLVKQSSLQPTVNANAGKTERVVKELSEAPARNIDLSIKIPQFQYDEKIKEFNFQSAPGSQIMSPKASKPNAKLTKSTLPLSSRNMEAPVLKNFEVVSPSTQSPHFRIKSHRETSFEKGQKDNNINTQISPTTNKQVPLIQMALSKNGHARFGSGGMVPQGGRTSGKVSASPSLTPQNGRDLKNLAPLGNLDIAIKDIRTIPHSASRREVLLMKGESKIEVVSGFAFKALEGLMNTDREKELTPLTPKLAVTHREKLISHKHTRSEGGRLKAEQLEALMGTINDQKIRELLRLNDGGPTGLSDLINKSRKSGESGGKNGTNYNGSNFILPSHRDGNYDSAPVTSANHQRKHSQQKNPGDPVITPRSIKFEVTNAKQKGQIKRMDSVGSESKQKSTVVLDNKDELKQGKTKIKFFG